MLKYVVRRLLVAVPMLLGAMSIVFFAMRILPGDPCVAMMGDQATTIDRKSTRLNSSHIQKSRMPSSA